LAAATRSSAVAEGPRDVHVTCCGYHTLLEILATDYSEQFITVPAEVEQQLLRINLHKSPGHDGLPNWMLRDFAHIISEALAALLNASLL